MTLNLTLILSTKLEFIFDLAFNPNNFFTFLSFQNRNYCKEKKNNNALKMEQQNWSKLIFTFYYSD